MNLKQIKILIIVSVISIVLVGCGEKKISYSIDTQISQGSIHTGTKDITVGYMVDIDGKINNIDNLKSLLEEIYDKSIESIETGKAKEMGRVRIESEDYYIEIELIKKSNKYLEEIYPTNNDNNVFEYGTVFKNDTKLTKETNQLKKLIKEIEDIKKS